MHQNGARLQNCHFWCFLSFPAVLLRAFCNENRFGIGFGGVLTNLQKLPLSATFLPLSATSLKSGNFVSGCLVRKQLLWRRKILRLYEHY